MTVAELIKELENMPQDYDVRICSTNASYNVQGCTVGCAEYNLATMQIKELEEEQ